MGVAMYNFLVQVHLNLRCTAVLAGTASVYYRHMILTLSQDIDRWVKRSAKGQLISKCLFGVLKFFQKKNKNIVVK